MKNGAEAFEVWDQFLGWAEGGGELSLDPSDPGNWTSGKPGIGMLVGTRYGIAASSHPHEDIRNMTAARARFLRRTEFWDGVKGDLLPGPMAFVTAEAAYGSWVAVAARTLQETLGVEVDGDIGPETIGACEDRLAPAHLDDFLIEFSSRRLIFESGLGNWGDAKGGWTRRLFRGLLIARSLAA